ncbi:AraC family transcriptional regulator [Chitinophaga silvisoli]|uniref:AraC family transcriptional regulator n=1 Tax=Chitinophaga silvisoli TaxID=2291814 RepID=A0A3E1NSY3_9BACT|nr:AraC family transcriptional regulator [Chitinophaga silvisoli]RFM31059.1 AraC family transcriptional regulator [Chitinophaga silvisoli]
MSTHIPTYQLGQLTTNDEQGIFFLGQKPGLPKIAIDQPYRSNFYKLGVCVKGHATVNINLDTYQVLPGNLLILAPHVIKQWTYMSPDYKLADIFFTRDFITTNNHLNPDKFSFFWAGAKGVIDLPSPQSISNSIYFIQQKCQEEQTYKDDVLRNLVNSLLYEIAAIYTDTTASNLSRGQLLVADFKRLVNTHFMKERSLKFYADQLFITPKHLTETLREITGKTAGDWISEAVTLEAKVLLQSPGLNISQISDMLHFADQSTFGKFFKNQTGMSPATYKQGSDF